MRITQQDIARIASVSQATVSRVLAGDDRVEQDIRSRVLVAIEDNNYRPDVRARSLRKQRTNLIGLVVRRDYGALKADPFFTLLISEILNVLSSTPFHLCVDMATSLTTQGAVYDQLLRTRRVDGLILVESEARDDRIHRLQSDNFPFVLIGNPVAEGQLFSVDNDNELAGKLAARHLFDQGYQRIGMLAGPRDLTVSKDRAEGYRQVASEFGQKPFIWNSGFGFEAALDSSREILGNRDRPDALVVLDDYMAMGVVHAARELNISIPQQLGIVGFNDTSYCDMLENGLTSVSLNIPMIVQRACRRLLKIIEGSEIQGSRRVIVPCELKVRGSSVRRRREAAV